MHGLMSGDWKRSTVSGQQRLQRQCVDSTGPNGHRASPRLYPRPRSLLRSQARCALSSGATPRMMGLRRSIPRG